MKRHGYIYENIISIENLERADAIAQRGKKRQYGVITHNKNRAANIQALHEMLVAGEFKTSKYTTFKVYEPKERIVYSLPYFPDRILHHAIMLQLDGPDTPTPNIYAKNYYQMDQVKSFSDFGIKPEIQNFTGNKIAIKRILDKKILVKDFKLEKSKVEGYDQCLTLQIVYDEEPRVVFTGGKYLIQTIQQISKDQFPFSTKIILNGEHLEFS